ncbi:MAG: hypothetical protein DRI34_09405 [Deltaproteobacteria bacterium]|nr:MAG: hypothetical protein DRI34_09405 [Deltaproteobacteria bacterium]
MNTLSGQPADNQQLPEQELNLFVFRSGSETYAADPELVQEVVAAGEPTAIPFVPDWVEGVVSVRGKIVPVIDLVGFFGLESTTTYNRKRLILFAVDGVEFGLWSEQVLGIKSYPAGLSETPLSTLPATLQECLQSQLRHQEVLVYILDMNKLLEKSRQQVAS